MDSAEYFEDYPKGIVVLSNIFALSIWAIGAFILFGFGLLFSVIFIIYCFLTEVSIYRGSCVNCCYYGKVCFSGRGKISALMFKRGDPHRFINRKVTFKDLLPDLMVTVIPIIGGIILLITSFSWLVLILIIVLLLLATGGNAIIRGRYACRYCRQRELGCPAQRFFEERRATRKTEIESRL